MRKFNVNALSRQPAIPDIRINNRRYLGNKYRLLPFIRETVYAHCRNVNIFADLFAGTGAVSSAFQNDCSIITNDILYSNYIANFAWLGAEDYNETLVRELLSEFNGVEVTEDNYMSENFADTYFSGEDCRRIGYIRQRIEDEFSDGNINFREKSLLLTSLLYAMDRIAQTCGHYDAYRKGASFISRLELYFPKASHDNNPDNRCYNEDINQLAPRVEADVIYLDPPYNSRQYCDTYHLPENVARWEKPEIFGVARKMDRSQLKSVYCTKKASEAFADLVNNLNARYILLSYNNMAKKGDDRSNARISDEDIMNILSDKGTVEIFSQPYRAFTAGKSDLTDNRERLFLCTCDL